MRTICGLLLAVGLFGRGLWGAAHQEPRAKSSRMLLRPASVAIEDIRVGQRVLTEGAFDRSGETAVNPETWRHLRIQAALRWDDGTRDDIEIESLLPPEWVAERGAAVGALVPIPIDLVEMGLPEDLVGTVVSNEPSPTLQGGPGRIVLTTINHPNRDVIELSLQTIDGQQDTLRPTAFHKFFSATRDEWVSAVDLGDGEQLRGVDGPATVVGIHRVPGIHRVYNMTVESEHVYRVSKLGVLVHNADCIPPGWKNWFPGLPGSGPTVTPPVIPTPGYTGGKMPPLTSVPPGEAPMGGVWPPPAFIGPGGGYPPGSGTTWYRLFPGASGPKAGDVPPPKWPLPPETGGDGGFSGGGGGPPSQN